MKVLEMAATARPQETVKLPSAPLGERRRPGAAQLERAAIIGTTILPAPLLVYLGVNSGGYPRGITAVAAALMGALLALRAVLAPRTVRRPGMIGLIGAGALFAFAAWQLLSAGWSESAVRAIREADRTVLYLLVFLAFATLPRRPLRAIMLAVGAAIVALTLMGLVTRLRPDLFDITQNAAPERLAFPLTYWNAMGVLIACGLVLCLHFASEVSGPRIPRVLGAVLFPALSATLYLTLSRGGFGAAVAGLAIYVVLARPRGLLFAAAAIGPPTFLVLTSAYDATALISPTPTSAEAVRQGRDLASTILVGCVAAGAIRMVLLALDRHVEALRLPTVPRERRPLAWGAVAALVLVTAFVGGAPAKAEDYYERFVRNAPTSELSDSRSRLTEVYNAGRISHWNVALDASRDKRLQGLGAGMFDEQWFRDRPSDGQVTEAHSLYVETLAELGVVGLGLLTLFIGAMLAAAFSRRHRRTAAAAVAAVIGAWGLHAALDWDWEMPAVTLIAIILGGAAAAVPAKASHGRRRFTPAIVALGAVILAVMPTLSALAETSIGEAQRAYTNDECPAVIQQAERARSLQPMRPEPNALLALCALRTDRPDDALRFSRRAVATDAGHWEWRYLNALVIGATGGDPRPELAAAAARNPRGVAARSLRAVYRETPRALWPVRSVQAYVWMDGRAYAAIRP